MKAETWKRWNLYHKDEAARAELAEPLRLGWERAVAAGIDPEITQLPCVGETEAEAVKRRSKRLFIYAQSIANAIVTKNRRTPDTCGLLFDYNGILLKIYGGDTLTEWLDKHGIREWTRWSESEIGPNIFSLGIAEGAGASAIGAENYQRMWADCSFYFSPITLGENKPLGGLALMVPLETYEKFAWGFTEAICHSIELQYLWFDMLYAGTNVTEGIGFLTLDQSAGRNYVLTMSDEIFSMLGQEKREIYYEQLERIVDPPPSNLEFWSIIRERRHVSDLTLNIECEGKRHMLCISTSRYAEKKFHISGMVIVFHSFNRIRSLASRFTTSVVRYSFADIIGDSPVFLETLERSRSAAASESNILLLGESGVGKDVIAQAIHNSSFRKKGPFVAVNCATFSKELISSELFGYEEGAFTGARRGGSIGKFELANGGTLFLDEIGDMPTDLQAVLLRVLEERSFMKVGGNRTIRVDVRIIAATNKNLPEKVRNGLFREDLFYRLGIVRIHIPPIRRRGDDIFLLADYFISSICKRQGKPRVGLSESARQFFRSYPWPGNVRELQNLLEGIISTQDVPVIDDDTVRRYLGYETPGAVFPVSGRDGEPDEREQIRRALKQHRNNRTKAAQALGMSRRTFYRRLAEYGIDPGIR